MSIKLTQREVISRISTNKSCILDFYPHPHSPLERSEIKKYIDEAHRKGHSIVLVRFPK